MKQQNIQLANSTVPATTSAINEKDYLTVAEAAQVLRMTRKEVSEAASSGMTTLYRFELGNMTDISFNILLRLLRVIGLTTSWESLIPELPESPYSYDDKGKKIQRVKHRKS